MTPSAIPTLLSSFASYNKSLRSIKYDWYIPLKLDIISDFTVVASYDGMHIAAVGFITGPIYISNDRGGSFRTSSVVNFFYTVAISGNGQYIVATNHYQTTTNYLYISSDYGYNWVKITPPHSIGFTALSISYSGSVMYGTQDVGDIYISYDYGYTWTGTSAPKHKTWISISSSSSGANVAAAKYYKGLVYTSNNYGSNWNQTNMKERNNLYWVSVSVSSDDGKYIGVMGYTNEDNYMLACGISHNYGIGEWIYPFSENNTFFMPSAISVSNTGQYMVITFIKPGIIMSNDYGLTWDEINNAPNGFWSVQLADYNNYIIGGSNSGNSSISIGILQLQQSISKSDKGLSVGEIIGIVISVVVFIIIIILYIWRLQRNKYINSYETLLTNNSTDSDDYFNNNDNNNNNNYNNNNDNTKIMKLYGKTYKVDICVICQVNTRNILFQPCKHLCICNECDQFMKTSSSLSASQCPICRCEIQESEKLNT